MLICGYIDKDMAWFDYKLLKKRVEQNFLNNYFQFSFQKLKGIEEQVRFYLGRLFQIGARFLFWKVSPKPLLLSRQIWEGLSINDESEPSTVQAVSTGQGKITQNRQSTA